jgi:hypothetical protein
LACNKPSGCASTIETIDALEKRVKLLEVLTEPSAASKYPEIKDHNFGPASALGFAEKTTTLEQAGQST